MCSRRGGPAWETSSSSAALAWRGKAREVREWEEGEARRKGLLLLAQDDTPPREAFIQDYQQKRAMENLKESRPAQRT